MKKLNKFHQNFIFSSSINNITISKYSISCISFIYHFSIFSLYTKKLFSFNNFSTYLFITDIDFKIFLQKYEIPNIF